MGWETRGNGQYFYRKRKVKGKVISEYMGGGVSGELMAQLDAHERQQAAMRRNAWQELQKREAALDQLVDEVGDVVGPLVEALLLTTGYHLHKRQWRKQRGD